MLHCSLLLLCRKRPPKIAAQRKKKNRKNCPHTHTRTQSEVHHNVYDEGWRNTPHSIARIIHIRIKHFGSIIAFVLLPALVSAYMYWLCACVHCLALCPPAALVCDTDISINIHIYVCTRAHIPTPTKLQTQSLSSM